MLSAEVSHIPTVASLKTIKRLVSLIHLILKPPFTLSHSENAAWMSLVLSSFGKPVNERMRVTQAESWDRDVAMSCEVWARYAYRMTVKRRFVGLGVE